MKVSDAVLNRRSIRAFKSDPIENSILRNLLEKSSRAATGGNLQPWKISVLNGQAMKEFLTFQAAWTKQEIPGYDIYPSPLKEPYRARRTNV